MAIHVRVSLDCSFGFRLIFFMCRWTVFAISSVDRIFAPHPNGILSYRLLRCYGTWRPNKSNISRITRDNTFLHSISKYLHASFPSLSSVATNNNNNNKLWIPNDICFAMVLFCFVSYRYAFGIFYSVRFGALFLILWYTYLCCDKKEKKKRAAPKHHQTVQT